MLGLGRNCNQKDTPHPQPPCIFPCGRKPSLAPDLNSALFSDMLYFSKLIPVLETISNRLLLSMGAERNRDSQMQMNLYGYFGQP